MFDLALGLGQGGVRITSEFQSKFKVPAAYVNLSITDFSKFKAEGRKLNIECGGTGRDPELGFQFAKQNKGEILAFLDKLLTENTKRVLVCIGGGGGSGSGLSLIVLPYLVKKGKDVLVIYTLPEKKEKLPAKPNALKILNKLIERYLMQGSISMLLIDNEYCANRYSSSGSRFEGVNKALPKIFNRFYRITNLHDRHRYVDFSAGYNALDINELMRVLFFSKGFLDFRIFELPPNAYNLQENELKKTIKTSSMFVGSFDINTSKIALATIALPLELKNNKKVSKLVDNLFVIIGKMTKAPYVFNSSYYDSIKNIRVNIILGGLTKSKSLDSLIKQSLKDKALLDNKASLELLNLEGVM